MFSISWEAKLKSCIVLIQFPGRSTGNVYCWRFIDLVWQLCLSTMWRKHFTMCYGIQAHHVALKHLLAYTEGSLFTLNHSFISFQYKHRWWAVMHPAVKADTPGFSSTLSDLLGICWIPLCCRSWTAVPAAWWIQPMLCPGGEGGTVFQERRRNEGAQAIGGVRVTGSITEENCSPHKHGLQGTTF